VVTDVAAEGLDLQRAARVIHYDLPWTPMRLEQREGRSVRYGSQHSQVEVLRFAAPPVLERMLRLEATLARKAKLPGLAGLGGDGSQVWRWRASLAEQFGRGEPRAGVAAVAASQPCLLAGFSLSPSGDPASLAATVLWLAPDDSWSEQPEAIATHLAVAARQHQILPVDTDQMKSWLALLAVPLRERMALIRSRRWVTPDPSPTARRLAGRLQSLIRDAARRHQATALARLERAFAFVAGGHTAGEAMLVDRLAQGSSAELIAALSKLPTVSATYDGIEVRLNGLILFGPGFSGEPALALVQR
jgi:Helicase conserved C-terminal domain